MATLCESFGCFHLNSLLTLSNIVESREGAIYICVDLFPSFDVEDRVALRDFTDENPVLELTDLLIRLVAVLRHCWHLLKANRTHIMIVTMVDVGLILRLQTIL